MSLGQTQIRLLSCWSYKVYYSYFFLRLSAFNFSILERPIDPGDTQIAHYLIATWAKVCQAMGTEFEPYLPVVMHSLLLTASAKADLSVYGMCDGSYIGSVLMASDVL